MRRLRTPKAFSRKSKAEIVLHIFVSLIFFAVCASYCYLIVWAVFAGLKSHTEVILSPFTIPSEWHWEHFIEVFQRLKVGKNNFFNMVFNSVWFSVGTSALTHFFTAGFAYVCTKYKFPGSNLPYLIILIMITLPIYGNSGATYKLYHSLGLVNNYAQIIAAAGGFNMFFLYYRAFYQNLSWTYAEAAMVDGADDFQIYFRIMSPMAKPIMGALFITSWLANWNAYDSALVFLPNLPTLPVGIYQFNTEMIYQARLDILFAACVIVMLPALILFTVFNKTITTNVSIGGLKG